MPAQGTGDSDRMSHEENEGRQPRRHLDSNSDEASALEHVLEAEEEDSPVIAGNNQFSAAIAAIQQVTQEVHQLLDSMASPLLPAEVAAEPSAEEPEVVAESSSGEWEDLEEGSSGSGDSIDFMDADEVEEEEEEEDDDDDDDDDEEEEEEEEDPFEDESDPFEGERDLFEDEEGDFVSFEFPFVESEDYVEENFALWDISDSNQSMDASFDTEVDCSSGDDSDLMLDPNDREVFGSMPEPKVPLHTAVVKGDAKSLSRWQAWNTSVWARRVKGDTSLHFAARSGDVATVEQLLQDGSPLGVTNKKRHTPLEVAALCGHAGVVKVLLKHGAGADSEEIEHALLAAKSTDVIRVLVEDDKDAVRGVTGAEMLSRAARDGRVTMVRELLKAGADANWPGTFSRTALHAAADKGHIRCVSALLESGADVTALDDRRWTPLHCAAFNSHGDVVQLLVQSGSDLTAKNGSGQTPFDIAFDEVVRNILFKKL